MSARTFRLITTWHVPAPADRVWEVLADPAFSWPDWWPGLRAEATGVIAGPDGFGGSGSWVRLRVRSPIGGALHFRLDMVSVRPPGPGRPGRARLRVQGGLRGGASVLVSPQPGGHSRVRLTWVVTPANGWPALVARTVPALCEWAHARVMRSGERGLVRHVGGVVSDVTG
ncbi:SRPBCC family protein [Myceligenerans cantabricum]